MMDFITRSPAASLSYGLCELHQNRAMHKTLTRVFQPLRRNDRGNVQKDLKSLVPERANSLLHFWVDWVSLDQVLRWYLSRQRSLLTERTLFRNRISRAASLSSLYNRCCQALASLELCSSQRTKRILLLSSNLGGVGDLLELPACKVETPR